MASKILRRSGVSVHAVMNLLDHWEADHIYQVGVGRYHQEINFLKKEWPNVQITGFEAHPGLVEARKKEYPGELIHRAISNESGTVELHVKKRHVDGSSLHPFVNDQSELELIEVPCSTLDHMIPDNPDGRVLLWLDCEGSELAVLRGGESFVRGVHVLNIEMTSKPNGLGWASPGNIHHWLREHGFLRQWTHTHRSSAGQYDAIYVRREMWDGRFCCDPYPI